MIKVLSLFSAIALAVVSSPATAQEDAAALNPGQSSVTVVAVEVAPAGGAPAIACVSGGHVGVDPADAATAVSLVCDALRSRGVAASGPVSDASGAEHAYRVTVMKLGTLLLFELSYEAPAGLQQRSRQLRLATIEDAVVAADRLARAVIEDQPVDDTATVRSLVHTETRQPTLIASRMQYGLGLGGFAAMGGDEAMGYGVDLFLLHSGARFSAGMRGRLYGGDAFEAALTVSGRLYFTEANISPYIDAGFGLFALALEGGDAGGWSNGGLGASAEVGVELMRFSRSRIGIGLHADLPFFALEGNETWDTITDTYVPAGDNKYVVPVGLSAYYVF